MPFVSTSDERLFEREDDINVGDPWSELVYMLMQLGNAFTWSLVWQFIPKIKSCKDRLTRLRTGAPGLLIYDNFFFPAV